jgi:hypothetical protein
MPSAKEQIADHLAKRGPGADPVLAGQPGVQRIGGVGLDADRERMAVSRWSDGQMPGSGEINPNPVYWAMPTQSDHTSAAAGAARTNSGQDRTVRPGRAAGLLAESGQILDTAAPWISPWLPPRYEQNFGMLFR